MVGWGHRGDSPGPSSGVYLRAPSNPGGILARSGRPTLSHVASQRDCPLGSRVGSGPVKVTVGSVSYPRALFLRDLVDLTHHDPPLLLPNMRAPLGRSVSTVSCPNTSMLACRLRGRRGGAGIHMSVARAKSPGPRSFCLDFGCP